MSCHHSNRHELLGLESLRARRSVPITLLLRAGWSIYTESSYLLVLDRFLLERCQVLHSRVVLAGLAPCLLLASQLYRKQLTFKAFALGQTGLK